MNAKEERQQQINQAVSWAAGGISNELDAMLAKLPNDTNVEEAITHLIWSLNGKHQRFPQIKEFLRRCLAVYQAAYELSLETEIPLFSDDPDRAIK